MPMMDAQQALQSLSQNKINPVYFLLGEERYFTTRCVAQLRSTVLSEDQREFNEEIFYGTEVDMDRLVESLQMLPIMADRRLVILKEAQHLSEKDWSLLDSVFDLTVSSKDLVFVVLASQLDKRRKNIKKWLDQVLVVDCSTPQEAARAGWIKALAQSKGLELDQEALAYLVRMGGNTLDELDRDLDKIYLYFGDAQNKSTQKVTIGDVANILQRSREESIFALSEAVGQRDRPQALFLFHRLKDQGENEIALVALMARHLRILLKLKKAQELKIPPNQWAAKVGVNQFFLNNYTQQAKGWNSEELAHALQNLADMDKQLKSSSLPGELWMERFLFSY